MRLNKHALNPAKFLKKVKECESKANTHFAFVHFTFNGKLTEKKFGKK